MATFKSRLREVANAALRKFDLELVNHSEWKTAVETLGWVTKPDLPKIQLPDGAAEALAPGSARLEELRRRYSAASYPVTRATVWTEDYLSEELDLRSFRSDNAYVWQQREGSTELRYALTWYYLKSIDKLRLLERLGEDELFGVESFRLADGKLLSRDLLDSIAEIYFLERNLAISQFSGMSVIDIGAGYGRLAFRLLEAIPNLARVLCTDAIPESTFLSEYYLDYRGVGDRAKVVPLDEIEAQLALQPANLATNIHSFSEMSFESVKWWLELVREHEVRNLMIVPNTDDLLTSEEDGSRRDYRPLLEQLGYELASLQPKYLDPVVQQHGLAPGKLHYLFRLRNSGASH